MNASHPREEESNGRIERKFNQSQLTRDDLEEIANSDLPISEIADEFLAILQEGS